MAHLGHDAFLEALKNHKFDKIECRRLGKERCLVVYFGQTGEVFPNRNGDRMVFRNVWQWKEWLQKVATLQVGELSIVEIPIGM